LLSELRETKGFAIPPQFRHSFASFVCAKAKVLPIVLAVALRGMDGQMDEWTDDILTWIQSRPRNHLPVPKDSHQWLFFFFFFFFFGITFVFVM
jgi:hypothetical protein